MAAEKATLTKRSVSKAIIPKEPKSVPKELDISPEIRDQEKADQSMLVESETSSETSNSAHLVNQASGVSLPASIQEEQEILKDCLAANIDSDDDFDDKGVCANCNREPKEGTELTNSSCAPAVTSPDIVVPIKDVCGNSLVVLSFNGRTVVFTNLPTLLLPKGLQQRRIYSVILILAKEFTQNCLVHKVLDLV